MTVRTQLLATLALAPALLLGACADDPLLGKQKEPMVLSARHDLPPHTGSDLVASRPPYRIGPLDKLSISVFGVEDLSGKFQTDAAARLSMPLIGEMDAAGQTPGDLARSIASRLKEHYVRDPQVTVNLEETTSQVFTVDGQVTQPGNYAVEGDMSLVRAVATAKGVSEYARLDDVVVFRTVNGQSMAALYNLDAIRRGIYPDPKIYAHDIIVVGDSKARRAFQQFVTISPMLTTPLILILEHVF
jgi:polysaccharide export outer membrane protein